MPPARDGSRPTWGARRRFRRNGGREHRLGGDAPRRRADRRLLQARPPGTLVSFRPGSQLAGTSGFSSNTYSCWASRRTSVFLVPSPTTNSTPRIPGPVVRKEIVPSAFLREAISLFHSPKSNTVAFLVRETEISPRAGFM